MIGSRLWAIAGWTMLHYFWVGAALGAAAIFARRALRPASANIRYAAALGSLLLLAAAPVVIAAVTAKNIALPAAEEHASDRCAGKPVEMPPERMPMRGGQPTIAAPVAPSADVAAETQNAAAVVRDHEPLSAVFNPLAVWLPWLWVVGAPLSFLLTTAGLLGAERLRRQSRPLEDDRITEMCRRLAAALNMSRRVSVGLCDRIAVPILVGVLRPMILLPAAALAGWSPEQLEMVLLHELAHVRRFDNLVNLAQRIIESALFFHPMVWIVSGWARREREHCCDELVVARTQRPHEYAEVLVSLAERIPQGRLRGSWLAHPQAVSSFVERPLVVRIRRILKKEEQTMQVSRKAVGLALVGTFALAATIGGYWSLPSYAGDTSAASKESSSSATSVSKPTLPPEAPPSEKKVATPSVKLLADSVKPVTGKNFVVVPFTSELQRAMRWNYDTATFFVLINAAPMIDKDDSVLDVGAVDFKGLHDVLQVFIKARLLTRVIVEGDVGPRNLKFKPGSASSLLFGLLHDVPPTDDRDECVSHRFRNRKAWEAAVDDLKTPPAADECRREQGIGDELVRVYPICTPLSRYFAGDEEYIIRNIKPYDQFTAEDFQQYPARARAYAAKLGFKPTAKARFLQNGGASLAKTRRAEHQLHFSQSDGSKWWAAHGINYFGQTLWGGKQYMSPRLLIRVTDEKGNAVNDPNITVAFPVEIAEYDKRVTFTRLDDGRWRSAGLLADDEFTVTVQAAGYQAASQTTTLHGGAVKDLEVRLSKKS